VQQVQFGLKYNRQFRTGSQDRIAVRCAVHKSNYAAGAKIGSAPVFIGLYENHGRASAREHLLGIGSEHKSFEPSASVRAQDNEVLFQLFGVFGDAPGHIALWNFVHVAGNVQSPAIELFDYQCQIPLSACGVLEVSVTMYASRGALLDHVKKFNLAPKPFGEPLYDRKNRFSQL
jgi:hypothetical protein